MIKEAIARLIERQGLKRSDAYEAMKEIMEGTATASQIAGFLVALRAKGETPEEIAGCALSMRDAATGLALKAKRIVDTCGTGGDGKGGLNISTAASFVVSGAGFTVAKHGNRAISSRCGSADVLEVLGVRIDPPVAVVEECLNKAGVGFLFAPNFHPAMKNAMPTRRELGIRTVFNLLGPLTNPARAQVQLIGVYEERLIRTVAEVMAQMGHLGGLAIHSHGWDEITLDRPTQVAEVLKGRVRTYQWTHKDFGLPRVPSRHLAGSDGQSNARVVRAILDGEDHPARDVVIANAGALIWIAERAFTGKPYSLKEAVGRARKAIDDGAAAAKLKQLVEVSGMLEP